MIEEAWGEEMVEKIEERNDGKDGGRFYKGIAQRVEKDE